MSAVGRNDPCPCGSGKKYKSCHMMADRAAAQAARLLGDEEITTERWEAVARKTPVWAADVAPLTMRFREEPDTDPSLAIVTVAGFILHLQILPYRTVGLARRAAEIATAVAAVARQLGFLPERLHVRDEALAAHLADELAPRGIVVEAAPMPELDEALDSTIEGVSGAAPMLVTAPATWRETDAADAEIAELHAAAAAFHRARPWTRLRDTDAFLVHFPDGRASWAVSVLGGAGLQFGIVLYSDPADLVDLFEGEHEPLEFFRGMRGIAIRLDFDSRAELGRAMAREVAAAGWEVAAPAAYPHILGMRVPGRRVTAEHVWITTRVLRAVTARVEGRTEDDPSAFRLESMRDEEPRVVPWAAVPTPLPIGPRGRGADPAGVLRARDDLDAFLDQEERRSSRLLHWLEATSTSRSREKAELRNAEIWAEYLIVGGIPAGAVTELELRAFVFAHYLVRGAPPRYAVRDFPSSLARILEFLEKREKIVYPFAGRVLADLGAIAAAAREWGGTLEDGLEEAAADLYRYLESRCLFHERQVPGISNGWPLVMDHDLAVLETELQRWWLIWYDEELARGAADHATLRAALVARQRAWENTPNPAVDGRTPVEVLRAAPANPFARLLEQP